MRDRLSSRRPRGPRLPSRSTGALGPRPRLLPRQAGGPCSRTRTKRGKPVLRQQPGPRLPSRSTGAPGPRLHLLPSLVCAGQYPGPSFRSALPYLPHFYFTGGMIDSPFGPRRPSKPLHPYPSCAPALCSGSGTYGDARYTPLAGCTLMGTVWKACHVMRAEPEPQALICTLFEYSGAPGTIWGEPQRALVLLILGRHVQGLGVQQMLAWTCHSRRLGQTRRPRRHPRTKWTFCRADLKR